MRRLGPGVGYGPESVEGLVWWQGRVGHDKSRWRQIQGVELEKLVHTVTEIQAQVENSTAHVDSSQCRS